MVVVLKVVVSLAIGMLWYKLTANQEISIAFFVLMLVVLFIRPIAYQSPLEREEFKEKLKKSKERQINIELARKKEKQKLEQERKKRRAKEGEE
ncbi:hypothetical protein [Helicobacter burdigaliensis]|uniref:hypothetical protein n=1 Tax=Helicobacter burdigaliensis TaxID=2315334 RepID=UPI000EF65F6C|nr:hypothetical protein [Helicobacter burdigaliensis]